MSSRIFTSRGLLYFVGGTISSWGGYNFYAYFDSKNWPRVDGRILGVYPYYAWLGDDKERYHVDYEYSWEGETHIGVTVETGSAWAWWMGNTMRDTIGTNEIKKGRIRPGGRIKVFVNPSKPHQCGLFRTVDPNRNGYITGIGVSLFPMAWMLPKNHKLEIVRKIHWYYKRRISFDTRKTRVIDVIFDRNASAPVFHKEASYKANTAIRNKLGLDSDKWDADVQQKRINRLRKEAEKDVKSPEDIIPPKISSA